MIKRLLLITVLFAGFMLNSCNKLANQLAQSLGWQGVDVQITVPATSDTSAAGTGTFTYNLDSFITASTGSTLGIKNVDTLTITSCVLTITDPAVVDSNNSFGNFKSASVSFSTSVNTTQTSMGEIADNPATVTSTLTLPVNTTANLRSYLPSSGAFTVNYSFNGKLRKGTTLPITANVHVTYHVHVTP